MTINHDAKGQSQVNLSDLLLSTAPGAVGTAPVAAAKGENPQELALFDGFAQAFAVSAPTAREVLANDVQAAGELPGGNALPDETGNILPDLAAPALAATPGTAQPVPQEQPVGSAAPQHEMPAALVQVSVAGAATTSAQAQRFEGHDNALRASERQALYMRSPVVTEQVERPVAAPGTDKPTAIRPHAAPLAQPQGAEMHPPRPETSRAGPLPEAPDAPLPGARPCPFPAP